MKKKSSLILLAVMVCLWGGFYDFAIAIYGVCFGIGLIVILRTDCEFRIVKNYTTVAFLIMFAGFLVSAFAACDKGMAWLGLLRIAICFLFWILWCNLQEETKECFWCRLTDIVAIVTTGTIFCYFIPSIRSYLFHAGRLGGVLQYSNTYAMLLLILLISLFYQKRNVRKWMEYVEAGIFVAGIIWCGSRSVFVLTILALLILLIKKRKQLQWKWILLLAVCIAGIVCVSALLVRYDLGRFRNLTLSSSTLNGRILYWRDAVLQLVRHPAGLGYMGYYFMQPQFQTGNYTVMYVHNDILQFGLDGGWLAMAGLLWMFFENIFNKKNADRNRLILSFLFLHVLFDFDLQYGVMFCLMLMCMDTSGKRAWRLKRHAGFATAAAGLAISTYFAIALGSSYFGNQKLAIAMYPGNTFAWEEQMAEANDVDSAERIIQKNGMLASAYECRAVSQISSGDYKNAGESVAQMLERAGYDSDYYNQAVYELSYCLQMAVEADDMEQAQEILEQIQNVPDIIEEKKKQATIFAWRINDSPKIELEESISQYIENIKGVTLE